MINVDCNIILAGAQREQRSFDTLSEFVVFSVIQTMTQARRGQYDGNLSYLAEWAMLSEDQVRRHLQNLVKKGYIEAEQRAGKSTIYTAIPLAKMQPLANCNPLHGCNPTPPADATPTPPADATPHLKYIDKINNINNPLSKCARVQEIVSNYLFDDCEALSLLLKRLGITEECESDIEQLHTIADPIISDYAEWLYISGRDNENWLTRQSVKMGLQSWYRIEKQIKDRNNGTNERTNQNRLSPTEAVTRAILADAALVLPDGCD